MFLMFDPLQVNLEKQLGLLLSNQDALKHITEAQRTILQNPPSGSAVLTVLSHLLRSPPLTALVAQLFRPLLVDLCARWLECYDDDGAAFVALAFLLGWHPELYPVLLLLVQRPSLQGGPLVYASKFHDPSSSTLHILLVAYYRVLWSAPHLPDDSNWPLQHLGALFTGEMAHDDPCVRFLAIRCFSLQTRMGEAHRNRLLEQSIVGIDSCDMPLFYGRSTSEESIIVDGFAFPFLERKRLIDWQDDGRDIAAYYTGTNNFKLQQDDLSSGVVCLGSILLIRENGSIPLPDYPLVFSAPIREAVNKIALCVSTRVPILLTSPPASGKRSLINYVASRLFPKPDAQIVILHLGDTSLDPRSILGSYISSPTNPGQFEWQDGVLVQAMKEGKWLLLKDIDKASVEMHGTLVPLIEGCSPTSTLGHRVTIDIPSRGQVTASPSFALFATRSTQSRQDTNYPPPTFIGSHRLAEICLGAPGQLEQIEILKHKFSRFPEELVVLIRNLWQEVKSKLVRGNAPPLDFRHLERFCCRVDRLYSGATLVPNGGKLSTLTSFFPGIVLREEMIMEARDIFLAGTGALRLSDPTLTGVLEILGQHLGFTSENLQFFLSNRDVACDLEKDVNGEITALRIGRHRLVSLKVDKGLTSPFSRPFVLHRPARDLLSRIASGIQQNEPLLLVGETGTGKTSLVSFISKTLRQPLLTFNMSMQTESSDLLGGFRPLDARRAATELLNNFMGIFEQSFSRKKNPRFEHSLREAIYEAKWKRAVALWRQAVKMAREKFSSVQSSDFKYPEERRSKRAKTTHDSARQAWLDFEARLAAFEHHHVTHQSRFAFAFVEGPIAQAIRDGHWVLLDEINLASPETLESIAGLLEGPKSSIALVEKGSLEHIPRHSNFRLFACMNPATDVGKRDLPPAIRSRFVELYVDPPDIHMETLVSIVEGYLGPVSAGDRSAILDVAEFYVVVKRLSVEGRLADGSNHRPHYSVRTLARALTFVADFISSLGLRRALWEGVLMAFAMSLDVQSLELLITVAQKYILRPVKSVQAFLSQCPSRPDHVDQYQQLGGFWLRCGPLPIEPADYFILTPSVKAKISNLARAIAYHHSPILIEGPTSSGKTSSVEYIARRTGHRFIRINNHEHTDIQEYLGSYQSDPQTGKLVFQDGLLVRALRRGDWIVLDELNLAPTEVLEALNRLLDDNRELLVPDTQEIVKPHPDFMCFATQNPHGLYGGRKVLSRAFRNRFLEFSFDDVPQDELETIVCERCAIAPSFAKRIVNVFRELQKRRQATRVFESKHSFATLRDVFRWANRSACSVQALAEDGFMLLAERARREEDRLSVKEVIESSMNVRIDTTSMYDRARLSAQYPLSGLGSDFSSKFGVVWTESTRRAFILLSRALENREPVLLVGDPGSGKTTLAEVFSKCKPQRLHTVNCHQNTEAGDIIGSYRPIRNRAARESQLKDEICALLGFSNNGPHDASQVFTLFNEQASKLADKLPGAEIGEIRSRILGLNAVFEWQDGPLVHAMRNGELFLLDELSLVDDSVLERLNSVLEPERRLILVENSSASESVEINSTEGFQVIATMNPGGDFGKKELSPALRNRFTEIWVPCIEDNFDIGAILLSVWRRPEYRIYTQAILQFKDWLSSRLMDRMALSLRDILNWAGFINFVGDACHTLAPDISFHHAAYMTYIDGLPTRSHAAHMDAKSVQSLQQECNNQLQTLVPCTVFTQDISSIHIAVEESCFRIGPFSLPRLLSSKVPADFQLETITTRKNLMRTVRACQMKRPILLEGSPGVGKTSLVAALATIAGCKFTRINLSDQTDLMDLFGNDLPKEGGQPGEFVWKEADFLKALQEGGWVLLDEMNLASQTVLEGLNAIFDHRGAVYLPDLDRTFKCHPDFRVFAAQNPMHEGGGRKGLPKSFTDRFTMVYVDAMIPDDMACIIHNQYPTLTRDVGSSMIQYNLWLREEMSLRRGFGTQGAPWEFNLRDILRWAHLSIERSGFEKHGLSHEHVSTIFLRRFRTLPDIMHAAAFIEPQLSPKWPIFDPWTSLNETYLQVGNATITRQNLDRSIEMPFQFRHRQKHIMESVIQSLKQRWLVVLTGQAMIGKTSIIRLLSNVCGTEVTTIYLNGSMETSDLLGGFEQVDRGLFLRDLFSRLTQFISTQVREFNGEIKLLLLLRNAKDVKSTNTFDYESAICGLIEELKDMYSDHPSFISMAQEYTSQGKEHFQWRDGPLVKALRSGHWIILKNANLCPPSVLDRLNSLCEVNGVLTLSERGPVNGVVERIVPHPDFRLFMTVNPQHGELSRAMRNRGIELNLDVGSNFSKEDSSVWHQVQATLQSRALASDRFGIQSDNLSGNDTLSETLLLQAAVLKNFSEDVRQNALALIGWLLHVTPLKLLQPVARLWAVALDPGIGRSLSLLSQKESFKMPISLLPQLSRHRNSLESGKEIPMGWLDWQPLNPRGNPNLKWSQTLTADERNTIYALDIAISVRDLSNRISSLSLSQGDIPSGDAFDENQPLSLLPPERYSEHVRHTRYLITRCLGTTCSNLQSIMDSYLEFECRLENLWKISLSLHQLSMALYSDYLDYLFVIGIVSRLLREVQNERQLQSSTIILSQTLDHISPKSGRHMSALWRNFFTEAYPNGAVPSANKDLPTLPQNAAGTEPVEVLPSTNDDEPLDVDILEIMISLQKLAGHPGKTTLYQSVDTWQDQCKLAMPHLEVHRSIWTLPSEESGSLNGPARLLQPLLLERCLRLSDSSRISLGNLLRYENVLRIECSRLSVEIGFGRMVRSRLLSDLCLATRRQLKSVVENGEGDDDGRNARSNKEDKSLLRGDDEVALWVDLGFDYLQHYIPDVPLDPLSAQIAESASWSQIERRFVDQIQLLDHWEVKYRGVNLHELSEDATFLLDGAKQSIQPAHAPKIGSAFSGRSRLRPIFTEIWQFISQIASPSKIGRLLEALKGLERDAWAQEVAVQHNFSNFLQRLSTNYSEYDDLIKPFEMACRFIQFGLRLSAQRAVPRQYFTHTFYSALVQNTSIGCAEALKALPSYEVSVDPPHQIPLLKLAAFSLDAETGLLKDNVKCVLEIYEMLYSQWLSGRFKDEERARRQSSWFRSTGQADQAESQPEEEEEEELHRFFPEYAAGGEEMQSNSVHKLILSDTLLALHLCWTAGLSGERGTNPGALKLFNSLRFAILRSSFPSASLGSNLDCTSQLLRLSILHESEKNLRENSPELYDFYSDANLWEIRKALTAINQLENRLQELILQWPDQMVLHDLRDHCHSLLKIRVDMPLSLLLGRLETLLLRTADWESYASRDTSLARNQEAITDLVVQWRRRELANWSQILTIQMRRVSMEIADYWFPLYEVLIHRTIQSAERDHLTDEEASTHLLDVLTSTELFLSSSPRGQYERRLELLMSFIVFLDALIQRIDFLNSCASRTSRLLHSMHTHYWGFMELVKRDEKDYLSSTEKDVKEVVKIASWRDVNVLALKQSAQKSHHSLHKCIKKLRTQMRAPVTPLLGAPPLDDILLIPPTYATYSSPSSDQLTPPPDLIRFLRLAHEVVAPSLISQAQIMEIESLSNTVIETAQRLAKETAVRQHRDGLEKSLLTQKKRAWADLQKELKRLGISSATKVEVRSRVGDRSWLFEQPSLAGSFDPATQRCEKYFNRLLGDSYEIGTALRDHHPDLSTRELERGLGYHMNILYHCVILRSGLAEMILSWNRLSMACNRLQQTIFTSEELFAGQNGVTYAQSVFSDVVRLDQLLGEISLSLERLRNIQPAGHHSEPEFLTSLEQFKRQSSITSREVQNLIETMEVTTVPVISEAETELLRRAAHLCTDVKNWATARSEDEGELAVILSPLSDWSPRLAHAPPKRTICKTGQIDHTIPLLNALLVLVQRLLLMKSEWRDAGFMEPGLKDGAIADLHKFYLKLHQTFQFELLQAELLNLVEQLSTPASSASSDLRTCLPYLDAFLRLTQNLLGHQARWLGSVFKLAHVIGSILRNLSRRGFCRPQEQDPTPSEQESGQQQQAGTGFGEGKGENNIQDTVRDESQLEGLENQEDHSPKETTTNAEKNSMEMDVNDGELQDPEAADANEEEEETLEPDEVEDRVDELDPRDPNAVDEKLWNDPSDTSQESPAEDRAENKSQQKSGTADIGDKKEGRPPKESPNDTLSGEPQQDTDEQAMEEDAPADAGAEGAPLETQIPESEIIDFPDDLNLTNEETSDREDGIQDGLDDTNQTEEDHAQTELEEITGPDDVDMDASSPPIEHGNPEPEECDNPPIDLGGQGNDGSSDHIVPPGPGLGENSQERGEAEEMIQEEPSNNGQPPMDRGRQSEANSKSYELFDESFKASEDNNGGTDEATGKQLQTRRHAETPSSLGDRMRGNPEERLERLQNVINPIEAEAAEDIAMEQTDGENVMQYSHDTDDRWQALGPSGESEPTKLQSIPEMEPVTEELGDAAAQEHMDHFHVDMLLEPSDLLSGLKQSQLAEVPLNDVGFSMPSVKSLSLEDRKDDFTSEPLEEPKTTRTARDIQDAESIWRLLEFHTHDLSLLLCEQLRLILEPTLAARLKGDYRTGKRLNMKKIIPYIASEYTKDKIWLRRTKPSRREYQILISLDDSKSMGESQSISLAFHTLALVTMALNRLEAGDVAVAKFGESTEIVHEFGDGSFTSHVGARVINSFAFNQRATDVLRLVDYTINFLSEARRNKVASASAMDLWQLQIIISDGICQDHERLRTLLRLAEEKRIMIVFIVLDSLHSTADQGNDNSILTMNQVGYKTVAGRQEIEMRQYMDTFPFEYYVILRDVRSLPEILSSTLQQFFERLAEQ